MNLTGVAHLNTVCMVVSKQFFMSTLILYRNFRVSVARTRKKLKKS